MNQVLAKKTLIALASLSLLAVLASEAEAHSVNKQFGDFYGGMLHPVTALEHLVPILGLGLLAGQQGSRAARWMLLLFPFGLFVGTIIAINSGPNLWVEWFNRLSFIAIGSLIAMSVRLPFLILATVTVILGVSHGYENTADISSAVAMHLFVPGVIVTGVAMIAMFAAVSVSREAAWQKIAVRVVGSWIAAIGILILGIM